MKRSGKFYFSTRDLMMMAAMAALGGVASTYINFIGDFFQSLLGFAGTTQWAAGLHIIWIMLAAAIVGKPGAATMTGILKGFIEFLSGNTHGLLVLIVDILAGLIVDIVLLPNKDKQPSLLFYLAAGLASASNIFVFQFFASVPEDIITLFAILLTSGVAFVSGVLFGGVLVKSLTDGLRKIGILNEQPPGNQKTKMIWPAVILISAIVILSGMGFFYFKQMGQSEIIQIGGSVEHPYSFPDQFSNFNEVQIEAEMNGAKRSYTGVSLKDLINESRPADRTGLLKIKASDGYSFFLTMEEIYENPNLILASQKTGKQLIYNIVGANSSKAWVRGVSELQVIPSRQIEISGKVANPFAFIPANWLEEMDSTYINLNGESIKLQGVSLRTIWEYAQPDDNAAVMIIHLLQDSIEIEVGEFTGTDELRIFTLLSESGMSFVLGRMNGEVLLERIESIEIK